MKRIAKSLAPFLLGVSLNAGALTVEVSPAASNPEAMRLHAALVARVTACHEPAKSVLTANMIRMNNAIAERIPLRIVALQTPGEFAIIGAVDPRTVIDIAVTNPEYANYQPHVLIGRGEKDLQLAGAKRFYSVAPTDADVRSLVQQ